MMEIEPKHYDDGELFWRDNVATELFRKCESLPSKLNLPQKALDSFFESEHACHRTNLRLESLFYGWSDPSYNENLSSLVARIREKIQEWIGAGPPTIYGRFGPGATMSDSSRACTVPDKMSSSPTITEDAWPNLVSWSETKWASAVIKRTAASPQYSGVTVIKGNSFFTVPKSAKALRGCCKEPSINAFYQRGLGVSLGKRLKRIGFDLKDGQETHRKWARYASLTGEYSTIDLSSASDTVSKSLVKLLLPPRWYRALSELRSPKTKVDGRWVHLEKFSSMGNGFTFELETLLFGAIAQVVSGSSPGIDLFVFGDDIIVPTKASDDVLAALRYFGFTPNKRKTFVDGWFRESCGGDYFRGVRVRAHNMEVLPSEPQHYISLANGIRRACKGHDGEVIPSRWAMLKRAWMKVLDCIPIHIRFCRGPAELGDIVIDDSESHWVVRTRSSIRYVQVYRPATNRTVRWSDFDPEVQMAAALYRVRRDFWGNLIPRDSVTGYRVGWVPFS